MKLSEALIERADLQTRMAQLRARLEQNAQVQEGEQPFQDPREILAEFEQLATQLLRLIQTINRTNSRVEFGAGETLSDVLARRDVLKTRLAAYRQLIESATERANRYSLAEIKVLPTINVSQTQKQTDEIAKELRELDTQIQALNWAADLVE